MRLKILRRTSIAGRPVLPGAVVDASDADARFLIGSGKAQEMADAPEPTEARKPRTRKPLTV
jgi:50S ribosomal subunit-associated GTPase HflX